MNRVLRLLGAVPHSPVRPFVIGLLWFTLAALAMAAVLYAVWPSSVWWIVAACMSASSIFSLVVVAILGRPYVRDIDTIRDNPMVHWTYVADEWARYEEHEWQRESGSARRYPLYTLIVAVISGGIVLAASRDLIAGLAVFGVMLGIGILVTLQTFGFALWRYRQRHRAAGDVFISQRGILQPRGYMPYGGFNLRLTIAEIEPGDPDMLRLQVSSYSEEALTRSSDIRVPIPYGREDEAREVIQQLLGASAARKPQPAKRRR